MAQLSKTLLSKTQLPTFIVFSKSPREPTAKSRLQKSENLDRSFVQSLHEAFIEDAFSAALTADFTSRVAYWYPSFDPSHFSTTHLAHNSFTHFSQNGDSFGARFENALNDVIAPEGAGLVIVGTDCPRISPSLLEEACGAVQDGHVVIGPAQTGGFYLLGLPPREPVHLNDCFSSGAESLNVIRSLEPLTLHSLPFLMDVDTEEDLSSLNTWIALAAKHNRGKPNSPLYIPEATERVLTELRM